MSEELARKHVEEGVIESVDVIVGRVWADGNFIVTRDGVGEFLGSIRLGRGLYHLIFRKVPRMWSYRYEDQDSFPDYDLDVFPVRVHKLVDDKQVIQVSAVDRTHGRHNNIDTCFDVVRNFLPL